MERLGGKAILAKHTHGCRPPGQISYRCDNYILTECDPLYNTTSETVYVDTVRDVGTVAEYRCNTGYKSDSEPLNVTCTGSFFWSGPALNCSLGALVSRKIHNTSCVL